MFNKILLTLGVLLLLATGETKAETTYGLHLGTYHADRQAGYQEFNPGIYVVQDSITAGVYYNSEKKISTYVGYSFQYNNFSLTVGGVTGYGSGIRPMLVPSYKIPGTSFRVAYLPQVPDSEKNTQALHLSMEF